MVDLSCIIFICMAVSFGLMLPLMDKKTRGVVNFMIVGIFTCLFVSELNNLLLKAFGQDMFYVTTTVTPVSEENDLQRKRYTSIWRGESIPNTRRSTVKYPFSVCCTVTA